MNKPTVLVVDDDTDTRNLIEKILRNENLSVVTAENGRKAIEEVEKSDDIDLILMDVIMPEMDGYEASRILRSVKRSEHIPIIMLTGKKTAPSDLVRGLEEGALEYLTKPFNRKELIARVNSMLRMKRLYDSNRELLEQLLEQKKVMESELKMAAAIQQAMLPIITGAMLGQHCKIESYYRATASIGGDFYDIFEYGEKRLAFFIADVSGHGPSAALIVAMLKTILFSEKHGYPSPSLMVQRLNDRLLEVVPGDRFVTAFFGVADFGEKSLTYSCAGHPPPLLLGRNADAVRPLSTIGSLLGAFEDSEFEEERIELESGDKIVLYSDGIFETFNKSGEMYGMKRLKEVVNKNRFASPKEIIENMVHDTDGFWDSKSDRDDIALLALEFD